MLGSLKGSSKYEEDDLQFMIDSALNEYFKVDRFLARGDVFCIHIIWNCGSEMCIACSRDALKRFASNIVCFKVVAMEPLNESILCVNCNQTALVLCGSVASAVPPDLFVNHSNEFMPLQADTVRTLAPILSPTLCLSALSSKFRIALFLYGPPGSVFDQIGVTSEIASVIREFTEPFTEDEESYLGQPANKGLYVVEAERVSRHPVLLVAAADSAEGLQPPIRRCFSHEIAMGPLTEAQRADMLSCSFEGVSKNQGENVKNYLIKDMIGQASGFMPRDIIALVADATSNFVQRILNDKDRVGPRKYGENSVSVHLPAQDESSFHRNATEHLEKEDFLKALERSKKRNASAMGTPKVPNVKWEDVGGGLRKRRSLYWILFRS